MLNERGGEGCGSSVDIYTPIHACCLVERKELRDSTNSLRLILHSMQNSQLPKVLEYARQILLFFCSFFTLLTVSGHSI